MNVIEEAKKHVSKIRGTDSEIMWDMSVGTSLNHIEKLIKDLEQHKAITEAAKFVLEVKRHKDTQPAQYQAFMPTAWRKLEEAVDNLGEDNNE